MPALSVEGIPVLQSLCKNQIAEDTQGENWAISYTKWEKRGREQGKEKGGGSLYL